jgi:outer membrane receptor protein involved in Fe transport
MIARSERPAIIQTILMGERRMKIKTLVGKKASVLAMAVSSASIASFAVPAQAQQKLMLEEVVITAQKREESLQDVPISVATVSGQTITESQIYNLQDMSFEMPDVTINEAPFDNNLFIRGIGSGVNAGFEKSVGLYMDDVYSGRGQLSRTPFVDIARVEVLKGPQGILFGKNTIGGAITVHTADPTDEFEGFVDSYYDPEHDEFEVSGVVSGPITDTVQGRIALNYSKLNDGYWENIYNGDGEVERENKIARVKLAWQATDNLDVKLKYEYNQFDDNGRQQVISHAGPGSAFGSLVSDDKTSSGAQPGFPNSNDTDTNVAVVHLDYQLGEHTLTSISAYSEYQTTILNDVMSTGGRNVPVIEGPFAFWVDTDESFDQWSQELRLLSPGGEKFDYIVGAYAETNSFDRKDPAQWPFPNADLSGQTTQNKRYKQDTDSWAVFAQGTWNYTDTLRFTLGARYTEDKKKLDFTNTADTILPPSVLGDFSAKGLDRKDTKDTYNFNAQWDVSDEAMLYATISTGFKGGGFDNSLNRAFNPDESPFDILAFDPEEATAYEVGAKTQLLDGAAELNVAIFRSEYDDLQTSAFDGVAGFTVGNAGSAIAQGLELSGRWLILEGLTVSGAFAYLDSTYDDFDNAGCSQYLVNFTDQCVNGVADLSGDPLPFAPDYSANISIKYFTPIGDNLEFTTNLDVMYTDSFFTVQDLDPFTEVDSYSKTNLRFGIGSADGVWQVAILGKNIFDKKTIGWANDITVSGNPGRANTYAALLDPPRTIGIQGSYRF